MTKPLTLALLALFLMLGVGAQAQTPAWEMRVCADPDSPPFSSRNRRGFDNRVAEILADELGARVSYVWWPLGSTMVSAQLREGHCDLIIGVPDGFGELLHTLVYYKSPYVFVYRRDSPFAVRSLDDPILHELKIGVQRTDIPPHKALLGRGLAANVVLQRGDLGAERLSFVIDAVARGEIDVGIAWGPVAGYYADKQEVQLEVVPVTPEVVLPLLKMSIDMTIAVRQGDEALRDSLERALVSRWGEIQQVIGSYQVPLSPLPQPLLNSGAVQ